MHTEPVVIIGHWKNKEVWINGRSITPASFVRDLKAAESEPGDNWDILQECHGVKRFRWGYNTQATHCLALACCFYLNLKWVMDRFFLQQLKRARLADLRLAYTENELQTAYEHCEDMFTQEFEDFMRELGAERFEE